MELIEAVAALCRRGLVAATRGNNAILGGLSVESDGSIRVYQDSFTIFAKGASWKAVVAGPGMRSTERDVANLAAAVDAIIEIYVSRGQLPG